MKISNLFIGTLFFVIFCSFSHSPYTSGPLVLEPCDCREKESISIDDVINLEPEGYDDWTQRKSMMDGTYYEATVIFSDGTQGRLFRGGNSGRHFVEDSSGTNYYYASLRAAVRALYLYKKFGCLSTKYRL